MAEFIASLQLAEGDGAILAAAQEQAQHVVKAKDAPTTRCFVNAGIIMVFPSSVPDQQREDALNSLLLIQLAADKQFNRNTQLDQWIKLFDDTSTEISLVMQKKTEGDLTVAGSQFTLPNLALQEMPKVGSMAKDVDTFKKVFTTFNGLPDTDPAVTVFHNKTYESGSHDTTVIFCSPDKDTGLGVGINILLLSLNGVQESVSRPLNHSYNTGQVKTKKTLSELLVIDEEVYAKIRQAVIDKLGDKRTAFIKEVTLN